MEVQLTADENAALGLAVHLIVRLLHESYNLNFYIPISKHRENFARAHQRDSLRTQKFFFRTNIYGEGDAVIEELSVAEIMFGKGDFKGLFHEVDRWIEGRATEGSHAGELLGRLKKFIWDKATGNRLTLASWMRKYVSEHPDYAHNSILSKKVIDDLLFTLIRIEKGEIADKNFERIFPDWKESPQ
jgi:glutamate--cysteine ligase catalytic subunit